MNRATRTFFRLCDFVGLCIDVLQEALTGRPVVPLTWREDDEADCER